MKKLLNLVIAFLLLIPGFMSAQNTVSVTSSSQVPGTEVVDPDRFFFFLMLGVILVFVLFIIIGLSSATSVLSKTLGNKYKSKA